MEVSREGGADLSRRYEMMTESKERSLIEVGGGLGRYFGYRGRPSCGLNNFLKSKEGAPRLSYHQVQIWGTRG